MECFIAVIALAFMHLMTYIWMFLIEAMPLDHIVDNSITRTTFTPVKQSKNQTHAVGFLRHFNANEVGGFFCFFSGCWAAEVFKHCLNSFRPKKSFHCQICKEKILKEKGGLF